MLFTTFHQAVEHAMKPDNCKLSVPEFWRTDASVGVLDPGIHQTEGDLAAADLLLAKALLDIAERFAVATERLVDLLTNPTYRAAGKQAQRPSILFGADLNGRDTFQVFWLLPDGIRGPLSVFSRRANTSLEHGVASNVLFRMLESDFEVPRRYAPSINITFEQSVEYRARLVEAVTRGVDRLLALASTLADVTVVDWVTGTRAGKFVVKSLEARAEALMAAQQTRAAGRLVECEGEALALLARIGIASVAEYRAEQDAAGAHRLSRHLFEKTGKRVTSLQLDKIDNAIQAVETAKKELELAGELCKRDAY